MVGIVKLNELYGAVFNCELINRLKLDLAARQGEEKRDDWANTFGGPSGKLKVSRGDGSQEHRSRNSWFPKGQLLMLL